MASFNRVMLLGNLTRDPQLKFLPSQTQVCEFGLAMNRKFKLQSGEDREEVTFVDVTAFGRQAEVINQYCTKGKQIFIEGRLKLRQLGGQERRRQAVQADRRRRQLPPSSAAVTTPAGAAAGAVAVPPAAAMTAAKAVTAVAAVAAVAASGESRPVAPARVGPGQPRPGPPRPPARPAPAAAEPAAVQRGRPGQRRRHPVLTAVVGC